MVGPSSRMLGVRVPPDPYPDILPDTNGDVAPVGQGMSVAPSLRELPPHRVPRRLRHLKRGARGRDDDRVFRMGEGDFKRCAVSDLLQLRPDPVETPEHGVIEPATQMPVPGYQEALAATRDEWSIHEESEEPR